METGPRFKVPSERPKKPGIEPATPGLQGERHNHCAMEASKRKGKANIILYIITSSNTRRCYEN